VQRSASPFCQGDLTLVRIASSPAAVNNATNLASKFGPDPGSFTGRGTIRKCFR
jgi:hypothetical protein